MIDADRDAPVFVTTDIDVDASPEAVWDTLTDLDSWPQWLPGVKSMTRRGPFAVGRRSSGARTGNDQVRDRGGGTAIGAAWKGRTMGMDAVHVWSIEPLGPTTTRVHTEESWTVSSHGSCGR